MPLASSLTVTVAPATAAPCGSLTMPIMLPVMSWAAAGIAVNANPNSSSIQTAFLILGDIPIASIPYVRIPSIHAGATGAASDDCFVFNPSLIEKVLLPDASECRQPRLPGGGNLHGRLAFLERRQRRAICQQA